MSITVFIWIAGRNSLAPMGAALEVNMVVVRTGIDDVSVNTFAGIFSVQILVKRAKAQGIAVRDSSKPPGSILLCQGIGQGVDYGVSFDILNLNMNT